MDKDIINKNEETIVEKDENGVYKTVTKTNEDGSFEKISTYNYNDPGTVHVEKWSTATSIGMEASFFKGKRMGMSYETNNDKNVSKFLIIFGLIFIAIGIVLAIFVNAVFGICWTVIAAWGFINEIIKLMKKNKK